MSNLLYIRRYKLLVVLPILLLLSALFVLVNQYNTTGEWFQRSIEMRGGTLITLETDSPVDVASLDLQLSQKFGPVLVRELQKLTGKGIIVEVGSEVSSDSVLNEIRGMGINIIGYSVETVGPVLGESFWMQAQLSMILAFIAMGIIVFIIFRTFVPSAAVIAAAASDILITLGFMQLLGVELSLASFAAIMMLIGYSVDTDILLTTRLLRGSGELKDRLNGAMKTGLTMTFTAIGAMVVLLAVGVSPVLSQIAAVLLIGLSADIINTWLQNSVILRWYCEKRGVA